MVAWWAWSLYKGWSNWRSIMADVLKVRCPGPSISFSILRCSQEAGWWLIPNNGGTFNSRRSGDNSKFLFFGVSPDLLSSQHLMEVKVGSPWKFLIVHLQLTAWGSFYSVMADRTGCSLMFVACLQFPACRYTNTEVRGLQGMGRRPRGNVLAIGRP